MADVDDTKPPPEKLRPNSSTEVDIWGADGHCNSLEGVTVDQIVTTFLAEVRGQQFGGPEDGLKQHRARPRKLGMNV